MSAGRLRESAAGAVACRGRRPSPPVRSPGADAPGYGCGAEAAAILAHFAYDLTGNTTGICPECGTHHRERPMILRPAALIALATFLAACRESAPPPPPPPAPAPAGPNAADLYRDCFRRFNTDLVRAAKTVTIGRDRTEFTAATGFRNPDDVAQTLKAREKLIRDLIDAARPGACDFGLPPPGEQEPPAVMELSAHLRNAARILYADAARLADAGDPGGAAERLGAIYGLSSHVADEPWLVIALTNAVIVGMASGAAEALTEAKPPRRLRQEDARLLEEAIARLDPDDPAGLARAQAADPADAQMQAKLKQNQSRVKSELQTARDALARIK